MARQRILYNIVGRYMNPNDSRNVSGYHIQAVDGGKSGRMSFEQTCFLVGRGQIPNVTAQLYKDKILLRGVGIDLASLPSKMDPTIPLVNKETKAPVDDETTPGEVKVIRKRTSGPLTDIMIAGIGYKTAEARNYFQDKGYRLGISKPSALSVNAVGMTLAVKDINSGKIVSKHQLTFKLGWTALIHCNIKSTLSDKALEDAEIKLDVISKENSTEQNITRASGAFIRSIQYIYNYILKGGAPD